MWRCFTEDMSNDTSNNRVKAVDKTISIIEALIREDGARVTELAEVLDYPQSTVHSHLATLAHNDLVVKEGDEYHVGLRWLSIGGYAAHRKDGYKLAREKTKELAEKTGERAQFVVEEHGRGVYLKTETGDQAVQIDARVGKRNYLHASSAGKSILAHLPKERVEVIINTVGLKPLTENTIVEEQELFEELDAIRERGYSLNIEESIPGLRAVGAPILDPNGEVVGALSVSGPSNRLSDEKINEEIPSLLQGITNEVELNIMYR